MAVLKLLLILAAIIVALGFVVLSGFLYQPDINLSNIFLAYFSGYLGVILSPAHFCLVLSSEYFKTDLAKVYLKFSTPITIIAIFGFCLYFLNYPWVSL